MIVDALRETTLCPAGCVFLATPFLNFARYDTNPILNRLLKWSPALCLFLLYSIEFKPIFDESELSDLGIWLCAIAPAVFWWLSVDGIEKQAEGIIKKRSTIFKCKSLIVSPVGDEATGMLTFASFSQFALQKIISIPTFLLHKGHRLSEKFFDQRDGMLFLIGIIAAISVLIWQFSISTLPKALKLVFTGEIELNPLSIPILFLGIFYHIMMPLLSGIIIYNSPLLISLVVQFFVLSYLSLALPIILFFSIPFGWDYPRLALFIEAMAEKSPPGNHEFYQIPSSTNAHSSAFRKPLAHSNPYSDLKTIIVIANWIVTNSPAHSNNFGPQHPEKSDH